MSFSCQPQLLSWIVVELGLLQNISLEKRKLVIMSYKRLFMKDVFLFWLFSDPPLPPLSGIYTSLWKTRYCTMQNYTGPFRGLHYYYVKGQLWKALDYKEHYQTICTVKFNLIADFWDKFSVILTLWRYSYIPKVFFYYKISFHRFLSKNLLMLNQNLL